MAKIYQLPIEHPLTFMGLKYWKDEPLTLDAYEDMGDLPFNNVDGDVMETLEDIYMYGNSDKEYYDGYKRRSISVSDIVELDGRYYYCDTIGWKDITDRINNIVTESKVVKENTMKNLYDVLELFQDGCDTGDNTWDWMCYVDYIPEEDINDNYDTFLVALAKNVEPVRVDRDYVLCDYTKFLENHWKAFIEFTQEHNVTRYALQDDDVLDDEDVFDIAFGTLESLISGGYSQNEYRAFVNDVLGYFKA